MRMLRIAFSAALFGMTLVWAQTDLPARSKDTGPRYDYTELSKVPEKARSRRNPLTGDETAAAGGRKLFEQHCAECHGPAGEGGKKAPSLRVAEIQDTTPGTLFWLLTNGVVRRGMPVWSKLPDVQRWQLVSYLQTMKTAAATDPASKPDAK